MSIVTLIPKSILRLPIPRLRASYQRLTGLPSAGLSREDLQLGITRAATLKMAESRAKEHAPGMHHARADKRLPPPGSIIEREYNGKVHRVTVLADAFEYKGARYTSLSTVAKEITGTIWNGFAFFGIVAPVAKPGLAKTRHTTATTPRATAHR